MEFGRRIGGKGGRHWEFGFQLDCTLRCGFDVFSSYLSLLTESAISTSNSQTLIGQYLKVSLTLNPVTLFNVSRWDLSLPMNCGCFCDSRKMHIGQDRYTRKHECVRRFAIPAQSQNDHQYHPYLKTEARLHRDSEHSIFHSLWHV